MTALRLLRTDSDAYGTFGTLGVAGLPPTPTCEPPWREWSTDGKTHHPFGVPFQSCVPCGDYQLIWRHSPKHGWCWFLQGVGVHLTDQRNGERFACLIHAANWPHQLAGCIALGTRHGMIAGARGVGNSDPAVRRLAAHLTKDEPHELIITRE